jgi:hypothetical protein
MREIPGDSPGIFFKPEAERRARAVRAAFAQQRDHRNVIVIDRLMKRG